MKQYITIWDLDYYYATNKKNMFNTNAMKVSSYHKQLGDIINFVLTPDDINRSYDKCYIFKDNPKTPDAPVKFILDKSRVIWIGAPVKNRCKWEMNDIILGCRPDYLLYPNLDTRIERAEYLRLFNNKSEPLSWIQDWTNTWKNKILLIVDPYMWFAKDDDLIKALKFLTTVKSIAFLEPIWIQKIISNKIIKDLFFQLKFAGDAKFQWLPVNSEQIGDTLDFIAEFKKIKPHIGSVTFDYRNKNSKSHWESKEQAYKDFESIRKWVMYGKQQKIKLNIIMPSTRFETPYFELFEELALWTRLDFNAAWLDWISVNHGNKRSNESRISYWAHPENWDEVFRDLLLQTYKYNDFICIKTGEKKINENDIPWKVWEREFKYEI